MSCWETRHIVLCLFYCPLMSMALPEEGCRGEEAVQKSVIMHHVANKPPIMTDKRNCSAWFSLLTLFN